MHSCRPGSGGSYPAALRRQPLRFMECQELYRQRPSSIADSVADVTAATAIVMAITDRTFAVIGGIDGFVGS